MESPDLQAFLSSRSLATFNLEPYTPRRFDKPWGYELHLTPPGLPYVAKQIHVKARSRLSQQVHDKKQESWVAQSGDCEVELEDQAGALTVIRLQPGMTYTCAIGQKHRLMAGDREAVFLEFSTPEEGTTFRLEDDYARPHETPEQRKIERGEV